MLDNLNGNTRAIGDHGKQRSMCDHFQYFRYKLVIILFLIAHLGIVERLKQKYLQRLPTMFEDIQRREETRDGLRLEVTSRMFKTIFTEAKLNIPLDSHHSIVDLLRECGVDIGYHHYERTSATRMTEFLSDQMHKILISNFILNRNMRTMPVSIIIDESADSNGRYYMVVYFQTIDNDVPIVYFYRLIEITSDETSQGYFDVLKKTLEENS